MSSSHTCKALIISCVDYRFVTKIRDFLIKDFKNNYDLITTPGASLNIEKIEDSITTSFKLHKPEKVLVFDHEDCGAYGNDNSEETHKANLMKARGFISSLNSNVSVNMYMAGFKGVSEIN